jgi:hypothetical protein
MKTTTQPTATKRIGYAYASSPHAVQTGFRYDGCWFIEAGLVLRGFASITAAVDFADTLPEDYDPYSYQFVRDYYSPHESNRSLSEASIEAIAA